LAFLRLAVDAVVDHAYGQHGQVERGHGRHDGDVLVRLEELDVALVVGHQPTLDVRPRDDPRRPEQHGDEPGAGDERGGGARRAPDAVRQRPSHREVAIEADDEEVGDRSVAHRVVERQPDVAEDWTQRPVAEDWTSS